VVVCADPLRIDQVVSNLLSNAIKYSPDGGDIEVLVETTAREAVISVRDQGVGIGAEEMPHVFAPFRRGKGSVEVAPGTGLGLSVVRRIVEAHGGRVQVESAIGRGSTFRVWLPLVAPSEAAPPG
jgi:two-component system, OmpR family, sensor histidine kinase MtrB